MQRGAVRAEHTVQAYVGNNQVEVEKIITVSRYAAYTHRRSGIFT